MNAEDVEPEEIILYWCDLCLEIWELWIENDTGYGWQYVGPLGDKPGGIELNSCPGCDREYYD